MTKKLSFGYNPKSLKKVFDKYCDKSNWKNKCTAIVPDKKTADKVEKAIIFFHGAKPSVREVPTYWRHKEGLVTFQGKPKYIVESEGYSAY